MNTSIKANIKSSATVPFSPDEAWIEDFTRQCTDEMRLKAKRFAARRARGVGKAGVHVDDYYVRELVQDALADTLLGVVVWDRATSTLEGHVLDTIAYRTRHARKRGARFKHSPIDTPERSDARTEIESSLRQDRDRDPTEVIFANEVLDQIRTHARTDLPVLCVLDAIEGGARTKTEILELSGMPAKTYRNARDRLSRIVRMLDQPNDLMERHS